MQEEETVHTPISEKKRIKDIDVTVASIMLV